MELVLNTSGSTRSNPSLITVTIDLFVLNTPNNTASTIHPINVWWSAYGQALASFWYNFTVIEVVEPVLALNLTVVTPTINRAVLNSGEVANVSLIVTHVSAGIAAAYNVTITGRLPIAGVSLPTVKVTSTFSLLPDSSSSKVVRDSADSALMHVKVPALSTSNANTLQLLLHQPIVAKAGTTLWMFPNASLNFTNNTYFVPSSIIEYWSVPMADPSIPLSASQLRRYSIPLPPISLYLNVPPVPSPDTAVVTENAFGLLDVLANDADTDSPLDPATLQLLTPPVHGTVRWVRDGSSNAQRPAFVGNWLVANYTPNPYFVGTDEFVYQVCDVWGGCNSTSVLVSVLLGDFESDISVTTPPLQPPSNGGPTVILIPTTIDGRPATASCCLTAPLNGGTVELLNNTLLYTPRPGVCGNDTVVYSLCDLTRPGACANVTLTMNVVCKETSSSLLHYTGGQEFVVWTALQGFCGAIWPSSAWYLVDFMQGNQSLSTSVSDVCE